MSSVKVDVIDKVADIVAAYLRTHSIDSPAELPLLIHNVYQSLVEVVTQDERRLCDGAGVAVVPVKDSVTPDAILCLEDGLPFKFLKRHLRACHGMTPEEYRRKWNLPSSYPMVAPNYAKLRSRMAKKAALAKNNAKKTLRRSYH